MDKRLCSARQRRLNAVLLAVLAAVAAGPAHAQLDTTLVASGLSQPLFATKPLAAGPLFVVERGGTIQAVAGGVASSFLSIAVETDGSEQGLLGLAFDPTWGGAGANANRFFVNYIDPTNGDTVIASYRTLAGNPALGDPTSRQEVIRIGQPAGRSNHKAGWIGFKPGDPNHLFIATGDGGGSNDPDNNGQNLSTLLGKMLRIDVNGDDFAADPQLNYAVPGSNPFAGTAGARGEIWAYGLRNPFRNSFDSNGNFFIADVGQGAREEINFIAAASAGGQNFGWRLREGTIATPGGVGGARPAGNVDPFLDFDLGGSQSITGGYVVREAGSPLFGQYLFADYISGRIWATAADGSVQTLATSTELTALIDAGGGGPVGNVSSFGIGAAGEIYIVDYGGKVVQVVPEPGSAALMLVGAVALGLHLRRRRA